MKESQQGVPVSGLKCQHATETALDRHHHLDDHSFPAKKKQQWTDTLQPVLEAGRAETMM